MHFRNFRFHKSLKRLHSFKHTVKLQLFWWVFQQQIMTRPRNSITNLNKYQLNEPNSQIQI